MREPGELADPFSDFEVWARTHRVLGPRTARDYTNRARQANRWMLHRFHQPLMAATPTQLRKFTASLPTTAASRNNAKSALVCLFDYFIDIGVRKNNPAQSLPRLSQPKPKPKPLALERVHDLIRAAKNYSDQFGVLAVLGFNTGLRVSELCRLEWSNVNEDFIVVTQKGGQTRLVYLNAACRRELRLWKPKCPAGSCWIAPSPRDSGRPMSPNWVWRKFRDIGHEVGIDFHPHMFRYSLGTRVYRQTKDLKETANALGHSGTANVHCYVAFDPKPWEHMEQLGFDLTS